MAVGVGVLVLCGWAWDQDALKRILPGFVAMNPLTAVGFALAGAALILLRPRGRALARDAAWWGAQLMAVLVMAIGGVKLIEYGTGVEIGLDRWLFTEHLDVSGQAPNRIAPNTALNFVLCGLALLVLDVRTSRGRKPAEFLGLAVALISLLAVIGYAYRVQWLYGVSAFIPMALHTALTFHLLGIGLIRARPEGGLMALWMSDTAGGVLLRWQLPGAVLILFTLGWLRLKGEQRGLYDTDLGVALHTTATIVIFGILIGWSARVLQRADAARRQEEAERERFFSLSLDLLGIAATDGYFKRINPAFTATLGWSREEFLGRPFLEFVHPDDVALTSAEVERLKQGSMR